MQSIINSLWAYALWTQIALNMPLATAKQLRITDGWNDDAGDYPYVVRLESNISLFKRFDFHVICTGTLLTNEWVLTAGHCLSADLTLVRYGNMTVPRKNSNTSQILKQLRHPKYILNDNKFKHFEQMMNDMGLLLIEVIHTKATGKLSSLNYETLVGKTVTIAGYGRTILHGRSIRLDLIEMENRPLQVGEGLIVKTMGYGYKPIIIIAPKCTKPLHGVLHGDSGGPLLVSGKVVAVATAAVRGSTIPHLQYYTPVSPYLDWIDDLIHKEKLKH